MQNVSSNKITLRLDWINYPILENKWAMLINKIAILMCIILNEFSVSANLMI